MSFQNRLAHFQDKRATRIIKNDITRSGVHLDVIHLESFKDMNIDERRIRIEALDFLPVVLPFETFEGMTTRYGKTPDGKTVTYLVDTTEAEAFTIFVTSRKQILNRDDLLFWLIENNVEGVEPSILILRVKELEAHFGSYSITHQGYKVTAESPTVLPDLVIEKLIEASTIRRSAFLAGHQREQLD